MKRHCWPLRFKSAISQRNSHLRTTRIQMFTNQGLSCLKVEAKTLEMRETRFMKYVSFLIAAVGAGSLFFQTGCASMNRSSGSGYTAFSKDQGDSPDTRTRDRLKSQRELGLTDDEMNSDSRDLVNDRTALRNMEKQLEGKRETEQYYKNKPYMRSDRERMAFLSIDGFENRERWLEKKGILGAKTPHTSPIQALIEVNDITIGMTKQAVRDSWGEPELVEVAGNPVYGNERWAYSEQIPSTDGYQTEHRLVYFESGRVVGWEKK